MCSSAIALHAQVKVNTRYEFIHDRNFYLGGENIAGMRADSVNISTASLNGGYKFGDNRFGHEAPRLWNAGADASTIMHLEKFSMYGRFSFDQTMMYDACGSMLLDPGRYPVDILEYTPGRKSRQNYAVTGGISVDVMDCLRVGARVDFSATNYAKLKDLRYTDYALDLSLRPGIQWVGDDISAGVALAFERSSETVNAEQVGESAQSYYAFVNHGAWYGLSQLWTGSGVHLNESGISGFPISTIGEGVSAQFSYKGLFAEASYLYSKGRIGEKDAIWYTFPEHRVGGILAWRSDENWDSGAQHTFRLDGGLSLTDLDQSVIDKVTEGGVTIRHNYGSNTIQRRGRYHARFAWDAVRLDMFKASASVAYENESVVASAVFPRADAYVLQTVRADAVLTWLFNRNWSIDGGLWFGDGSYREETLIQETAISGVAEVYRSTEDYEKWLKQCVNSYFGAKFALRYTFDMGIHLGLECSSELRRQMHRTYAGLSLGYTF